MAGETVKSEAICLGIRPWSRTSHVVTWLTPSGRVVTVVRGAVRPKSAFLGQYDVNYTCEIVYYAGGRGDVHALRECTPLAFREGLRGCYRAAVVAEYFRFLCDRLAPTGPEAVGWCALLTHSLDALSGGGGVTLLELVRFELDVLRLAGLSPDFSQYDRTAAWSAFSVEAGAFAVADAARCLRIARETAAFLNNPAVEMTDGRVLLDAARVLGVFYQFHVESVSEVRRSVLKILAH